MARKAFLDPATGLLKGHGFCDTNEPGDLVIDVPDTFHERPGTVKRVGNAWAPSVAPKSARDTDIEDAKDKIDAVLAGGKLDSDLLNALEAIKKVLG